MTANRARKSGPLRGIAVGIKDIMDTADFPTEMGSVIYKGFRSRGDAAVVMALKAAGASIIGKTTTTAFASLGSDRDAQSAQHGAHAGRIVVGVGRSRRRRDDSAGAGDADRRFGDPARLVLRLCGDQAVLSAAADRRRQMLFVDAGYGRLVRSRRSRCRARAGGDDRPRRIAAAGIRADAADRRGDAGLCRRPGGRWRRGAADRGEGGRARWRYGANAGAAGDRCRTWRQHPNVQEFEAHQALAWEYRENYATLAPNLRGRLDESKGMKPAVYDEAMRITAAARGALTKVFEEVDVLLALSAPGGAPKGLGSTGTPVTTGYGR